MAAMGMARGKSPVPRSMPRLLGAVLCVAAAIGSAGPLQAQTGEIAGNVVDAGSGQALPFASVGVVDTTLGANTGSDGRYVIRALLPGTYRLRASFIGYDPQDLTVTVVAQQTAVARFRLRKKAAAGVTEKVLVTAERPLVDVSEISSVRMQSKEDIAKLVVDDLSDVVEKQVGVAGEDEQLHIRGGRSDETLFRIENVAMKNVITGSAAGGTFSAKAIQSLQVITGGYEAEFGQAISGVVNVQLKEGGDHFRTNLEYHSGSFDTERMFMQTEGPLLTGDNGYPVPGKLSFLLGVDVLASDTYLPSLREATDFTNTRRTLRSRSYASFAGVQWEYDDFLRPRQDNSMNFYTKLTWTLNPRHKINSTFTKFVGIDHGFFRYRVGDEGADAASADTRYNYAFRDQMDQFPTFTEVTTSQVVNWRWAIDDKAFSTFSMSHFYNDQESAVQGKRPWEPGEEYVEWRSTGADTFFVSDDNGDFPQYRNLFVDRWSTDGSYKLRWRQHQEFKAGFEASYYTLQMIDITNPVEGEGGLGSVRDLYRVHPNDGAFFAQNSFSYQGFTGHAGLRADYIFLGEAADDAAANSPTAGPEYEADTNSLFGARYKLFWSPRLAINHPITERNSMHFNFGHFVQWPRFVYYFAKISSRSSEAFPIEGNLNLDPERSVQFEFGVKHQFTDDDAVDVTLFNKDTYDYPTATRTFEATRNRLVYVNSDFSRTRGIELVYQHRGEKRMSGNLSYEYQIATGKPADPNRIKQVDPEALETGDAEPDLNEEFMPWNRPHRLQGNLDIRLRKGDRPRIWKLQLPDRSGVNFYYTLRSGRPYTPTDTRGQQIGKTNSENAPFESVFDVKLDKYWDLRSNSRIAVSLEFRNLFDQQSLRVIDPNTGEAPQVGEGIYSTLSSDVSEEVVADRLSNPAFYSEGRNIRFGLELTF